jgi:hypothetical protein
MQASEHSQTRGWTTPRINFELTRVAWTRIEGGHIVDYFILYIYILFFAIKSNL